MLRRIAVPQQSEDNSSRTGAEAQEDVVTMLSIWEEPLMFPPRRLAGLFSICPSTLAANARLAHPDGFSSLYG